MGKTKIKAAVLTASDTREAKDDASGTVLVGKLLAMSAEVVKRVVVTDDLLEIREVLFSLSSDPEINLILTTGGTGFSPRDNTPEATRAVIEREAPGIAEAIRAVSLINTPTAMLSRGIAGIRGKAMIVNLPGSPKGASECFDVIAPILQHAVDLLNDSAIH
ncbi:MAG: MogA/MoaB family molybdenum cofactor biosynthesis protein [Blastocatellia bacterium]|nr:MogA/MoaB family molybdenum cofactor biosynthesis protein [Blastocatellia bacterium]